MPDHTARTRWPRAWTWAIVLTVALFGAHTMTRWWGPALVGEFTSFADVPPVVAILMASWAALVRASFTSVRTEADRVAACPVMPSAPSSAR